MTFSRNTIIVGDCLETMRSLPAQCVSMCVTSPPYWGLRDYGVAGQLGQEATPAEFVAKMVAVFWEVRRILRDDGTLWLNLGDSYARNGGEAGGCNRELMHLEGKQKRMGSVPEGTGLKSKDLCGIPWRVALALQADGWWLRQDIVWHKPNAMPESVTDRCTKAHEYIFLLTKSERYYFDHEAIKEPSVTCDPRRPYTSEGAWEIDGRPQEQRHGGEPRSFNGSQFSTGKTAEHQLGRASKKPRTAGNKSHKYVTEYEASETEEHRTKAGLMKVADVPWEKANRRSVWTVATKPYKEAHFATFPPDLIQPCILAGCPAGGLVFDPFGGSGTTGQVARSLGRDYLLCELNPDYVAMAEKRIKSPLYDDSPKTPKSCAGQRDLFAPPLEAV